MILKTRILNTSLHVDDRQIELPGPVSKVIENDEMIVVLLSAKGDKTAGRNLFCLSKSGVVRWQVAAASDGAVNMNPYVSLGFTEAGDLVAGTFSGFQYRINELTGEVSAYQFSKL